MDRSALTFPKRPISDKIPVPLLAPNVPENELPSWRRLPWDGKLPMPHCPKGEINLSRGVLGKSLYVSYPNADFVLSDPHNYHHPGDTEYNSLHDPNLYGYFSKHARSKELLRRRELSSNEKVTCSLSKYNQFRKYIYTRWAQEVGRLIQKQTEEEKRKLQARYEESVSFTPVEEEEYDVIGARRHLRSAMEERPRQGVQRKRPFSAAENYLRVYERQQLMGYRGKYPAFYNWLKESSKHYRNITSKFISEIKDKEKKRLQQKLHEKPGSLDEEQRSREENLKELKKQQKFDDAFEKEWDTFMNGIAKIIGKEVKKARLNIETIDELMEAKAARDEELEDIEAKRGRTCFDSQKTLQSAFRLLGEKYHFEKAEKSSDEEMEEDATEPVIGDFVGKEICAAIDQFLCSLFRVPPESEEFVPVTSTSADVGMEETTAEVEAKSQIPTPKLTATKCPSPLGKIPLKMEQPSIKISRQKTAPTATKITAEKHLPATKRVPESKTEPTRPSTAPLQRDRVILPTTKTSVSQDIKTDIYSQKKPKLFEKGGLKVPYATTEVKTITIERMKVKRLERERKPVQRRKIEVLETKKKETGRKKAQQIAGKRKESKSREIERKGIRPQKVEQKVLERKEIIQRKAEAEYTKAKQEEIEQKVDYLKESTLKEAKRKEIEQKDEIKKTKRKESILKETEEKDIKRRKIERTGFKQKEYGETERKQFEQKKVQPTEAAQKRKKKEGKETEKEETELKEVEKEEAELKEVQKEEAELKEVKKEETELKEVAKEEAELKEVEKEEAKQKERAKEAELKETEKIKAELKEDEKEAALHEAKKETELKKAEKEKTEKTDFEEKKVEIRKLERKDVGKIKAKYGEIELKEVEQKEDIQKEDERRIAERKDVEDKTVALEKPEYKEVEIKEMERKEAEHVKMKKKEVQKKYADIQEAGRKEAELRKEKRKLAEQKSDSKEIEHKEGEQKLFKRQEAKPKEVEIKEAERKEPEIKEIKRKKNEIKEVQRKKIAIKEADRKEAEVKEERKEVEIKEVEIKEADRKEAAIKEAERKEAEMKEADLKEAERREAEIKEAERKEAEIKETSIKEADLKEAEIKETSIKEADLKETEIKETSIKEADLKETEIKEVECKEAAIKEVDFKEAEIEEAQRKEAEMKEVERKETKTKEAERKEVEIKEAEHQQVKIKIAERREAEIKEAQRKEAEMEEIEVKEGERQKAKIKEVESKEVKIKEAERQQAKIKEAERKEAERQQAKLKEAERKQAEMKEAELKEAKMKETERKEIEIKKDEHQQAKIKEAERKAVEMKEAKRKEVEIQEAERQQAKIKEAERKEAEIKEAEGKIEQREAETKEAESKEAEIIAAERKEVQIEEPERKKPEIKEAERQQAKIKEAQRKEAEIKEAGLQQAEIMEAERKEAEMKEAELQQAEIMEAERKKAKIKKAGLKAAERQQAKIEEADRKEAEIKEKELQQAKIMEVGSKEAEIKEAEAKEAEIHEAERKEAEMKEAEIKAEPKEDEKKEDGRKETEIQEAERKEAEIKEAQRKKSEIKAVQKEAKMNEAHRKEAEIEEAERKEAKIKKVESKEAEMKEVELHQAEIMEAERKEAEIKDAQHKEAEIKDAQHKEAEIQEAVRKEAEIQEAVRKKAEIKKAERKEAEVKESLRKEAEIPEAERKKDEIKEAKRKETGVKESLPKEAEILVTERKEAEIKAEPKAELKEADRKESEIKTMQKEAGIKEAQRQETEIKEAARKEAKIEAERKEAERQEAEIEAEHEKAEIKEAGRKEAEIKIKEDERKGVKIKEAERKEAEIKAEPKEAVIKEAKRKQAEIKAEPKEAVIKEAVIKEAKRKEAEIKEAERKEAEIKAEPKEAVIKEAVVKEAEIKEVEREEAEIKAERKEAEIKEVESKEAEIKEAARKEAEIQETECKEVEIKETKRKEAETKETEREEAEIKEAERKEAEIKEAESKKAEIKEAKRKKAEIKEAERKEAEIKEAERKEAERKETKQKEVEQMESEEKEAQLKEIENIETKQMEPKRKAEEQKEHEYREAELQETEIKIIGLKDDLLKETEIGVALSLVIDEPRPPKTVITTSSQETISMQVAQKVAAVFEEPSTSKQIYKQQKPDSKLTTTGDITVHKKMEVVKKLPKAQIDILHNEECDEDFIVSEADKKIPILGKLPHVAEDESLSKVVSMKSSKELEEEPVSDEELDSSLKTQFRLERDEVCKPLSETELPVPKHKVLPTQIPTETYPISEKQIEVCDAYKIIDEDEDSEERGFYDETKGISDVRTPSKEEIEIKPLHEREKIEPVEERKLDKILKPTVGKHKEIAEKRESIMDKIRTAPDDTQILKPSEIKQKLDKQQIQSKKKQEKDKAKATREKAAQELVPKRKIRSFEKTKIPRIIREVPKPVKEIIEVPKKTTKTVLDIIPKEQKMPKEQELPVLKEKPKEITSKESEENISLTKITSKLTIEVTEVLKDTFKRISDEKDELKETEKKKIEHREAEQKDFGRQEAEREEIEQKKMERKRTELREVESKETELREAESKKTEIMEAERKETEIMEAERKETEIREAERKETEIREVERKEAETKEAKLEKAQLIEAERKEAEFIKVKRKEVELMETKLKEPIPITKIMFEKEEKKISDIDKSIQDATWTVDKGSFKKVKLQPVGKIYSGGVIKPTEDKEIPAPATKKELILKSDVQQLLSNQVYLAEQKLSEKYVTVVKELKKPLEKKIKSTKKTSVERKLDSEYKMYETDIDQIEDAIMELVDIIAEVTDEEKPGLEETFMKLKPSKDKGLKAALIEKPETSKWEKLVKYSFSKKPQLDETEKPGLSKLEKLQEELIKVIHKRKPKEKFEEKAVKGMAEETTRKTELKLDLSKMPKKVREETKTFEAKVTPSIDKKGFKLTASEVQEKRVDGERPELKQKLETDVQARREQEVADIKEHEKPITRIISEEKDEEQYIKEIEIPMVPKEVKEREIPEVVLESKGGQIDQQATPKSTQEGKMLESQKALKLPMADVRKSLISDNRMEPSSREKESFDFPEKSVKQEQDIRKVEDLVTKISAIISVILVLRLITTTEFEKKSEYKMEPTKKTLKYELKEQITVQELAPESKEHLTKDDIMKTVYEEAGAPLSLKELEEEKKVKGKTEEIKSKVIQKAGYEEIIEAVIPPSPKDIGKSLILVEVKTPLIDRERKKEDIPEPKLRKEKFEQKPEERKDEFVQLKKDTDIQKQEYKETRGLPVISDLESEHLTKKEDGKLIKEEESLIKEEIKQLIKKEVEPLFKEEVELLIKEKQKLLMKDADKPLKKEGEQLIKEGEPLIKEEEPLIKEEEPLIKEEEPLIKEEEPLIKEEELLIKEEEPLIKKEELLIKEEEEAEPLVKEEGKQLTKAKDEELIKEESEKLTKKEKEQPIKEIMELLITEEAEPLVKEKRKPFDKEEGEYLTKAEDEQLIDKEGEQLTKEKIENLAKEKIEKLTMEKTEQLTKEEIEKLTKEGIEKLAKEEIEKLTKKEIEKLTKEEIVKLTKEEIKKLTKEKSEQLSKEEKEPRTKEKVEILVKKEGEPIIKAEDEVTKKEGEPKIKVEDEVTKKEGKQLSNEEIEQLLEEETEHLMKEEIEKLMKEEIEKLMKEEIEKLMKEEIEKLMKEEIEQLIKMEGELLMKEEGEPPIAVKGELLITEEEKSFVRKKGEPLIKEKGKPLSKREDELTEDESKQLIKEESEQLIKEKDKRLLKMKGQQLTEEGEALFKAEDEQPAQKESEQLTKGKDELLIKKEGEIPIKKEGKTLIEKKGEPLIRKEDEQLILEMDIVDQDQMLLYEETDLKEITLDEESKLKKYLTKKRDTETTKIKEVILEEEEKSDKATEEQDVTSLELKTTPTEELDIGKIKYQLGKESLQTEVEELPRQFADLTMLLREKSSEFIPEYSDLQHEAQNIINKMIASIQTALKDELKAVKLPVKPKICIKKPTEEKEISLIDSEEIQNIINELAIFVQDNITDDIKRQIEGMVQPIELSADHLVDLHEITKVIEEIEISVQNIIKDEMKMAKPAIELPPGKQKGITLIEEHERAIEQPTEPEETRRLIEESEYRQPTISFEREVVAPTDGKEVVISTQKDIKDEIEMTKEDIEQLAEESKEGIKPSIVRKEFPLAELKIKKIIQEKKIQFLPKEVKSDAELPVTEVLNNLTDIIVKELTSKEMKRPTFEMQPHLKKIKPEQMRSDLEPITYKTSEAYALEKVSQKLVVQKEICVPEKIKFPQEGGKLQVPHVQIPTEKEVVHKPTEEYPEITEFKPFYDGTVEKPWYTKSHEMPKHIEYVEKGIYKDIECKFMDEDYDILKILKSLEEKEGYAVKMERYKHFTFNGIRTADLPRNGGWTLKAHAHKNAEDFQDILELENKVSLRLKLNSIIPQLHKDLPRIEKVYPVYSTQITNEELERIKLQIKMKRLKLRNQYFKHKRRMDKISKRVKTYPEAEKIELNFKDIEEEMRYREIEISEIERETFFLMYSELDHIREMLLANTHATLEETTEQYLEQRKPILQERKSSIELIKYFTSDVGRPKHRKLIEKELLLEENLKTKEMDDKFLKDEQCTLEQDLETHIEISPTEKEEQVLSQLNEDVFEDVSFFKVENQEVIAVHSMQEGIAEHSVPYYKEQLINREELIPYDTDIKEKCKVSEFTDEMLVEQEAAQIVFVSQYKVEEQMSEICELIPNMINTIVYKSKFVSETMLDEMKEGSICSDDISEDKDTQDTYAISDQIFTSNNYLTFMPEQTDSSAPRFEAKDTSTANGEVLHENLLAEENLWDDINQIQSKVENVPAESKICLPEIQTKKIATLQDTSKSIRFSSQTQEQQLGDSQQSQVYNLNLLYSVQDYSKSSVIHENLPDIERTQTISNIIRKCFGTNKEHIREIEEPTLNEQDIELFNKPETTFESNMKAKIQSISSDWDKENQIPPSAIPKSFFHQKNLKEKAVNATFDFVFPFQQPVHQIEPEIEKMTLVKSNSVCFEKIIRNFKHKDLEVSTLQPLFEKTISTDETYKPTEENLQRSIEKEEINIPAEKIAEFSNIENTQRPCHTIIDVPMKAPKVSLDWDKENQIPPTASVSYVTPKRISHQQKSHKHLEEQSTNTNFNFVFPFQQPVLHIEPEIEKMTLVKSNAFFFWKIIKNFQNKDLKVPTPEPAYWSKRTIATDKTCKSTEKKELDISVEQLVEFSDVQDTQKPFYTITEDILDDKKGQPSDFKINTLEHNENYVLPTSSISGDIISSFKSQDKEAIEICEIVQTLDGENELQKTHHEVMVTVLDEERPKEIGICSTVEATKIDEYIMGQFEVQNKEEISICQITPSLDNKKEIYKMEYERKDNLICYLEEAKEKSPHKYEKQKEVGVHSIVEEIKNDEHVTDHFDVQSKEKVNVLQIIPSLDNKMVTYKTEYEGKDNLINYVEEAKDDSPEEYGKETLTTSDGISSFLEVGNRDAKYDKQLTDSVSFTPSNIEAPIISHEERRVSLIHSDVFKKLVKEQRRKSFGIIDSEIHVAMQCHQADKIYEFDGSNDEIEETFEIESALELIGEDFEIEEPSISNYSIKTSTAEDTEKKIIEELVIEEKENEIMSSSINQSQFTNLSFMYANNDFKTTINKYNVEKYSSCIQQTITNLNGLTYKNGRKPGKSTAKEIANELGSEHSKQLCDEINNITTTQIQKLHEYLKEMNQETEDEIHVDKVLELTEQTPVEHLNILENSDDENTECCCSTVCK